MRPFLRLIFAIQKLQNLFSFLRAPRIILYAHPGKGKGRNSIMNSSAPLFFYSTVYKNTLVFFFFNQILQYVPVISIYRPKHIESL